MEPAERLRPYVAGLAVEWLATAPQVRHRSMPGSLAFVDISGFTTLTERLAAKGKVGAEEMSDLLNASFAQLLQEAYGYGAALVKWGGDAVLLLFEGPEHAVLACRAAYEMRSTMRRIGRLRTSAGVVQLRMSVGIDSGTFDFFLGGRRHRELLVAGPAATRTAVMEQTAEAGEIVVSPATAALLPSRCVGAPKGPGLMLRSAPTVAPRSRAWPAPAAQPDVGSCLDPAIRDHLLTEVGESEHRQVGVGFVEVSGVDDLLDRQGPGAVASALHELVVLVQEQCERHRVTFWETDISADGFKIMLVAGAPRSTGHDEDAMLRAARAVLDGHRGPVRVRIGVNAGRVFNGGFGPPFRRTWSVKGDAVNLAARVMGKAGDGQLLATESLLRRVGSRVSADLLPPFLVKGKRHPVRAAVVREVGGDRPAEAVAGPPFVGRVEEVDRLLAAHAAAAAGSGGAVALVGPAGSGKSRLLDHVCRRLPVGTTVLRSYASDYDATTSYFVMSRLLRSALGLTADTTAAAVLDVLRRVLAARAPALIDWLPLVALPAGLQLDDTAQTAAVQEQFRRQRVAALTVDLLTALCPGPTVFAIEDVHAADDASAELLALVARQARHRRWLMVLAGRGLPAGLAASAAVTRLDLTPLGPADARALVLGTDTGQQLAPHVVRAILGRADGNPLFLQELVDSAGDGDGTDLPGSIEELLAAQLDDLAPRQRQLLRVAAVLGTRFDGRLVDALIGTPVAAEEWLALDRFVTATGDGLHRFRAGLVRDAAYEGLPFRRRVELHGRAATAIESQVPGGVDDLAEVLSLHTFIAQRYDDAWRFSRLAGDRARQLYANVEALAFLDRARQCARRLPDLPATVISELLESIGDVHARLAELDAASAAYREARRRAPQDAHVLRARVAVGAALAATRAGRPASTMRWLSTAERDLATAAGTDPAVQEMRARVAVERATIRWRQGRHRDAATLCLQALAQAEDAGADYVVARALHILDINDIAAGKPGDEGRALRALELFERCGDLTRQAGVLIHLGIRAYYEGRWDVAVERYSSALQLHERSGDDWNAAIAAANVAEVLIDQGRLEEAQPRATHALRVWRVSGTPVDIGYGAALLARLHAATGRHAEALTLLQEAVELFAANDERIDLIDAQLRVVETLLLHGAATAAVARLDDVERDVVAVLRAAGVTAAAGKLPVSAPQTTHVLRLRGYALGQLGDLAGAHACLQRSAESARSRAATHDLARALDALVWLDGDGSATADRDELFRRLGIVWTPAVPRPAGAEGVVDISAVPGQRVATVPAAQ